MNITTYAEKQRLKDGLVFASVFILLLWIVKFIELGFNLDFSEYGIYPRTWQGMVGIITTPFIHRDFMHLFSNTVPLFVSIIGIFYFFRAVAVDIIVFSYLVAHFFIWIFAREAYHIGASGLVYAYISFLFFGGAFAQNRNMLALSLVLVFLYGTMFWGMLPTLSNISWESHLIGAITGLVFAFFYRKHAIEEQEYDWEKEEDHDDEDQEGEEEALEDGLNHPETRV